MLAIRTLLYERDPDVEEKRYISDIIEGPVPLRFSDNTSWSSMIRTADPVKRQWLLRMAQHMDDMVEGPIETIEVTGVS